MKFSAFFTVALFALTASASSLEHANRAEEVSALVAEAQSAAAGCGAAGACHGIGGAELCNDRCKRCSGPTGAYHRGACCGFLNQACCCYYS